MKFGPYFHSAKPDCAARAVRGTILTFDCSTTHVGSLARSGQFDVRLDRTASVELKRQAVAPPPQSTIPVSHPWMTTIQLRVVWIREPANHRSPSFPRRIPRRIVTTGVRPWMQRAIRRNTLFPVLVCLRSLRCRSVKRSTTLAGADRRDSPTRRNECSTLNPGYLRQR